MLKELNGYSINPDHKTQPIEFEKDDPTNFHIEFMGGVSNLRVYMNLYRLEIIKLKKLITLKLNLLLVKSSQLLLPLLLWLLVQLVLKLSNICLIRRRKCIKM